MLIDLICASLNERIEGFFGFPLLQQTCWHDKLILCIKKRINRFMLEQKKNNKNGTEQKKMYVIMSDHGDGVVVRVRWKQIMFLWINKLF